MKEQFINKIHRSGHCIYCIENITKGKKYIGQSVNITFRRESHRRALICGNHPNPKMQEDFNSGDIFEIKALEYFPPWTSKTFLNEKEYAYIKKYKTNSRGYNILSAPIERTYCKSSVEKYQLCLPKIQRQISLLNQKGGLTYLRIYDLCRVLNCRPENLMEYVPDKAE